jgi:hypothetical protein
MDIKGLSTPNPNGIPHSGVQLLAGNNASWFFEENGEQIKFFCGEVNRLT